MVVDLLWALVLSPLMLCLVLLAVAWAADRGFEPRAPLENAHEQTDRIPAHMVAGVVVRQLDANVRVCIDSSAMAVSYRIINGTARRLGLEAFTGTNLYPILLLKGHFQGACRVYMASNDGYIPPDWPEVTGLDSLAVERGRYLYGRLDSDRPTIILTVPPATPVLSAIGGGYDTVMLP